MMTWPDYRSCLSDVQRLVRLDASFDVFVIRWRLVFAATMSRSAVLLGYGGATIYYFCYPLLTI